MALIEAKFRLSKDQIDQAVERVDASLLEPLSVKVNRTGFHSGHEYVRVMGKDHEVMLVIGAVADMGEAGLESVSKVWG
jgi:hypothetical protein